MRELAEKRGFPSPCGELVGSDNLLATPRSLVVEIEFPSPCGELVGSDGGVLAVAITPDGSFRPLAGNW